MSTRTSTRPSVRRSLVRLAAGGGAALAVTAMAAAPASAHVTITPSGSTAAGDYTVLTFAFGHGCEDSPTTEIAIQVPEPLNAVSPTLVAGWTVEKQMEQLAEPIEDSHGNAVTERVAQVVYTADEPVPDGYRAAMDLSLQLPDTAGETLAFPVVQRCAEGETGWTQLAADGESTDDLDTPAPTVTITEAEGDTAETAATDVGQTGQPVAVDDDEGNNGVVLGLAGLAAGVIALLVALMALARTRQV